MTARELTTIHTGIDFGEGPRWHDGRLWFSDFYRHGVFTLDADGTETRVVTVDNQPSGLGWMPDGTLRVHADLSAIAGGKCNDLVVAADGSAYVGNFGFDLDGGGEFALARLARVTPDGEVHEAAADLMFPNGDGPIVFHNQTIFIQGEK